MDTPAAKKSRALPLTLGAIVFLFVAFLVLITSTLITFILPEAFASSARIRVQPVSVSPGQTNSSLPAPGSAYPHLIQTELEIIRSEAVLGRVIEDLDLNAEWGRRYAGGQPLKARESLMILKRQLDLRPVGNTSLIEIRVFSENPEEAANLANGITGSYVEFAAAHSTAVQVQIVDVARPQLRAVRPNKQLNIALGMVVGVVMGLGCGLITYWFALMFQRPKLAGSPPRTPDQGGSQAAPSPDTLDSLHKRF